MAGTILLALCVAACISPPTPPLPLPVAAFPNACRGVGLTDATLVGSPDDPRITWLQLPDGRRIELVWPPQYSARFTPELEVLDERSAVRFRGGDVVRGGCQKGPAEDPRSIILVTTQDLVPR